MLLTDELMYQAILTKDASYEGKFITGVKTTGIFCRPTCTAKKPKFINVEFFINNETAIINGYRPCKVCKPLNIANEMPTEITVLINELFNDPSLKIKDIDLLARGLEPHTVRRHFVKRYQMTFHEYQRKAKMQLAIGFLKNGVSVSATAYSLGFESVSGFAQAFKNSIGFPPSNIYGNCE